MMRRRILWTLLRTFPLLLLFCIVSLGFLVQRQDSSDRLVSIRGAARWTRTSANMDNSVTSLESSTHVDAISRSVRSVPMEGTLNMKLLDKIRLKPWKTQLILGGDRCPLASTARKDCPAFISCSPAYEGALRDVSFCDIDEMQDLENREFQEPFHLDGSSWTGLVHSPTTLSWKGQIVAVRSGVLVNFMGHVFNLHSQFLHGGCQDIPDKDHGGELMYNFSEVKVTTFKQAINLVHVYGDNYYHFLLEVMPRFHLVRSLLASNPEIPVLLHPRVPLHFLKLVGIDPANLVIHYVNFKNDLVFVSDTVYFPLAPRCLHAPNSLWKSIREQIDRSFVSLTPRTTSAKIVYISRLNSKPRRHIINESKYLALIRSALSLTVETGVESWQSPTGDISLSVIYGNETLTSQALSIAGSSFIIGPHGAGLGNMIFAPPSAKLVEIAPEGYWNPCFMYLANALEIRHWLIRAIGHQAGPLEMSPDTVEALVDWLRFQILEK